MEAEITSYDKEIKVIDATFVEKNINKPGVIIEITKDSLGVTCGDGIIYLNNIKPAGKNIIPVKAFINGIKKEEYLGKEIS